MTSGAQPIALRSTPGSIFTVPHSVRRWRGIPPDPSVLTATCVLVVLQCCAKSEPDLDGFVLQHGTEDVETLLAREPPATVRLSAQCFSVCLQR